MIDDSAADALCIEGENHRFFVSEVYMEQPGKAAVVSDRGLGTPAASQNTAIVSCESVGPHDKF